MNKKLKGFTMIELITVIAIIAVLAGILVPNMLQSIRKAKVQTANSEAKVIFNAAQTVAQQCEFKRITEMDNSNIFVYSPGLNISNSSLDSDIENKFIEDLSRYYSSANETQYKIYIDHYIVKAVASASSTSDIYVGRYPSPPTLDDIQNEKKNIKQFTDDQLKNIAVNNYN